MECIERTVDAASEGLRLDRFLTQIRPDVSRSEIQRSIRSGHVNVAENTVQQPAYRLRQGETITWEVPVRLLLHPHSLPLRILFEDQHLVAVDKPPGLIVHPGAGTDRTTLVEGLLIGRSLPVDDDPLRPGIVHRLDKETSGVLIVAKTPMALASLKTQFASRAVTKLYLAVVDGMISEDEGWIDAPVARDPSRPSRMGIQVQGRSAQTAFRVLSRTSTRTFLLVCPHTGRTHQIRVHLRYIEHPVHGDTTYGGAIADRLFLHAWRLAVQHPETGQELRLEAPPPAGFPPYTYVDVPWTRIAARK
jgi:23S rRNA pseudouridine1911/1915/1917 synthase